MDSIFDAIPTLDNIATAAPTSTTEDFTLGVLTATVVIGGAIFVTAMISGN